MKAKNPYWITALTLGSVFWGAVIYQAILLGFSKVAMMCQIGRINGVLKERV